MTTDSCKEIRIAGPPGTGKTTTLSGLVATACRDYGSEAVLVSSFTRTAAKELVSRNLPLNDEQVGTLHALCYRALDRPKILTGALLKDWNEEYPTKAFGGYSADLDDPYAESSGQKEGDLLLQELNKLRGLGVDEEAWPYRVQGFAQDWNDFKAKTGTIDFTDMIDLCIKQQLPIPHSAAAFFLDEVQDFSPLELKLARHWGQSCDVLYLVGDEDQCHPPDTLIRTVNRGDVPISELQSADRLRSFDRTGGADFRGGYYRPESYRGKRLTGGYQFQRSERHYDGVLHTFVTESGRTLSVTHDHRMLAQWTKASVGAYAVYLMQRGATWRVGVAELVRKKTGLFGPMQRARQEGADSLWILDVFDTAERAKLEEDYIAARYGVSKLVFSAKHQKMLAHSQESLNQHHARMSAIFRCAIFMDYEKDYRFPYWTKSDPQRGKGCHARQIVRAINCFPKYMQMLRDVKQQFGMDDRITEIKRTAYSGPVFSLNVEPYHTYVANEIVTPNCLYSFKGCRPDAFLNPPLPPEQIRVLGQSHRVPRAVHAAAVSWIEQVTERMPKDYKPRDFEGSVDTVSMTYKYPDTIYSDLETWLAQGKTVAFLASCSFFLDPLKHKLRQWGLPFHNPYRLTRGDWNPLGKRAGTVGAGERLLSFLQHQQHGRWWTYAELWNWVAVIEAPTILIRGAKTEIRRKAEDPSTANVAVLTEDMDRWIKDESSTDAILAGELLWMRQHFLKTYEKPMEYACNVYEKQGAEALTKKPQIILGTIHSLKGGEADIVVLFPDLSPSGYREWISYGEPQDSVRRCFYVGMTRAKESLYWAQPVGMSIGGYL